MLLNKHNFAVADFASKKTSRYTLQSIQVSDQGTCATDGYQLVRVSLPDAEQQQFPVIEGVTPSNGTVAPFLLEAETAKRIGKALPKGKRIPILANAIVGEPNVELQQACIAVTDLEVPQVFRPRIPTGQFPDVSNVILGADAKPVFEIAVSGELLARIVKAAAGFSDQRSSHTESPVLLSFYGADKAMTVQARRDETKQRFLSVLMPVELAGAKAGILK